MRQIGKVLGFWPTTAGAPFAVRHFVDAVVWKMGSTKSEAKYGHSGKSGEALALPRTTQAPASDRGHEGSFRVVACNYNNN